MDFYKWIQICIRTNDWIWSNYKYVTNTNRKRLVGSFTKSSHFNCWDTQVWKEWTYVRKYPSDLALNALKNPCSGGETKVANFAQSTEDLVSLLTAIITVRYWFRFDHEPENTRAATRSLLNACVNATSSVSLQETGLHFSYMYLMI